MLPGKLTLNTFEFKKYPLYFAPAVMFNNPVKACNLIWSFMARYVFRQFQLKLGSDSRNITVFKVNLIARFMGPTWGPSGADRTQVGLMLAPWTLLSGYPLWTYKGNFQHRCVWMMAAKALNHFICDWRNFKHLFSWVLEMWIYQADDMLILLTKRLSGPGEFPTQRPVTRSFDVFFKKITKMIIFQSIKFWQSGSK